MAMCNGFINIQWRLVVEGAETDPGNLLSASRDEIIAALEDGENAGTLVEKVLFNDDNGVPEGVTNVTVIGEDGQP